MNTKTLIMHVYRVIRIAVFSQDGTPATQCPMVSGIYGIGHGPALLQDHMTLATTQRRTPLPRWKDPEGAGG
ncbi:hypothetical protein GCM10020216_073360 [Nonomuraea helvata]